jgi:enoyl-CoA hydratase/carnithine racemase
MRDVRLHHNGPVAHLVLNRPDRRNALSLGVMRAVIDALGAVAGDEETRCLVVAGEGPAFSAGHDLTELATLGDGAPDALDTLFGTCAEMMTALQRLPVPVIARVHGVATAAGCQLVAACDLAVASDDARFATPGVNIGLFCSTPMVPLARTVGRKRALEMLLTGDLVDARTALAWGLVNQVVPRGDLDAAVAELAGRVTRGSRAVTALGKRAFYAQADRPETEAYAIACPVMTDNARLPDAAEGIRAFLEKRPPVWPGAVTPPAPSTRQ